MKDKFTIGEVEELLGVPRSTIRFYVKKGLVSVERNEENGYYYYTLDNVVKFSHLIVGRNRLNLGLKDSQDRTELSTLEEYKTVLYCQEQFFIKQIAEARRAIDVLNIYEQLFYRIKHNLGKISVLPATTFYVFPLYYVFNSNTSVIDVGFRTAVFAKEKKITFDSFVSFVYKSDMHLLSSDDAEKYQFVLKNRRFVTTILKTDRSLTEPKILSSALNWAKRNNVGVEPPFYVSYMTELTDEGEKYFYYEVFLPMEEDPSC